MSAAAQAPSPESINTDQLLLALDMVSQGGVVKSAGLYYFDHGRRVPEHLTGVFDRLVWAWWVGVAPGDPVWARRALGLTEAGQARYAHSREQHRRCYAEHGSSTETLAKGAQER